MNRNISLNNLTISSEYISAAARAEVARARLIELFDQVPEHKLAITEAFSELEKAHVTMLELLTKAVTAEFVRTATVIEQRESAVRAGTLTYKSLFIGMGLSVAILAVGAAAFLLVSRVTPTSQAGRPAAPLSPPLTCVMPSDSATQAEKDDFRNCRARGGIVLVPPTQAPGLSRQIR